MKLLVFAVRDSAAGAYLQPFFARSKGEAIRSFSDAANSEDHPFSRHADDYTLFQIGEYEDATGEIVPEAPVSMGNALEYRRVRDERIVQPVDPRQLSILGEVSRG